MNKKDKGGLPHGHWVKNLHYSSSFPKDIPYNVKGYSVKCFYWHNIKFGECLFLPKNQKG
jgi:hypothetical protein